MLKLHTEKTRQLEKTQLLKINESLQRYSKVELKREQASLERRELSDYKHRDNEVRIA